MADVLKNFSDVELAGRALAGSPACYEEIVRRYQVPLMRFLVKRFPSRRDAEDILQETFLKAWQSLELYDNKFAFRTWIYTIAFRLAVSRGRRQNHEEPLMEYDTRSDSPRPDTALQREDQHRSLWRRAKEILPEEQYMILWLHYVDEMPAGDIARILNRSWVSVKTLMHRARKKLMPHLVEEPIAVLAPVAIDSRNGRPAVEAGEP
jgi:RNA polymerase sigma-70 factor (ECF subfamily)